jgi:hypothetical protein
MWNWFENITILFKNCTLIDSKPFEIFFFEDTGNFIYLEDNIFSGIEL